ncbi:MAG TPA: thioredoxin family protein [Tepidisphaeraceae bacterium]|jgi:thiol:disulfide interchange protein|nr:thioredoxin family protein [Tepidisphaeraceae bacterium]
MPNPNRSNLWWLLLILAGVGAIVLTSGRNHSNGLIPWQTDYTAAAVQARTNHKLILLDFYADWCGPCRAMASETWTDREVADAVSGYVPVHVNVDDNPKLAQYFGVQGIPNILVLDGEGNVIARQVGEMGPGQFLDWLHSIPKS